MNTWEVEVGFKLLVGGPEEEPKVEEMRDIVRDMLVNGKLGVRQFRVVQVPHQDCYVRDLSGGEE